MLTAATEDETADLEVAAMHMMCDSTSDGSGSGDDDSCCGDREVSEKDEKFMQRAGTECQKDAKTALSGP